MEYIYWKSYEELRKVFENEFLKSKTFKDFVLLMKENMVEYRFMRQAGVIHPWPIKYFDLIGLILIIINYG